MSISEVGLLIGQRAGDIEKAREIFTAESRSFVNAVLAGVRRIRSEPWMSPRLRVDVPREIETESKTGYLTSQYARGRVVVRFKKGTNFAAVADVIFGIDYSDEISAFTWQVQLVPGSRYQRIDDLVWNAWRVLPEDSRLPGGLHQDRANTVRFGQRPLSAALSPEVAFSDLKTVLDFIVGADAAFAEACGVEAVGEEVPVSNG